MDSIKHKLYKKQYDIAIQNKNHSKHHQFILEYHHYLLENGLLTEFEKSKKSLKILNFDSKHQLYKKSIQHPNEKYSLLHQFNYIMGLIDIGNIQKAKLLYSELTCEQTCPICFDSLKDKCISVTLCNHLFCKECLSRFVLIVVVIF